MRKAILFASTLVGALVLTASVMAQEVPPTPPAQDAAADTAPALEPADTGARATNGEKWRFRWHDGRWWYWLPSERWVYWHADHWEDYLPPPPNPAVTMYRAAPQQQTSYRIQQQPTYYYSQPYTTGYRGYVPSVGFYIGGGHHHHGGAHWGGHHGGGHHGGGHHGGGHHGGGHHGGGRHGGGHGRH